MKYSKIFNRSESDLRRINSVLRKKLPPKRNSSDDKDDYEDVPTKTEIETISEDYDEPIPHCTYQSQKQYINI